MKTILATAILVAGLACTSAFAATSDDAKWVAKCVGDNASAKNVTVEIITSYCTCMNNEMDNNETRSISTWEKTGDGKVAMAKCDKESGWDKK